MIDHLSAGALVNIADELHSIQERLQRSDALHLAPAVSSAVSQVEREAGRRAVRELREVDVARLPGSAA